MVIKTINQEIRQIDNYQLLAFGIVRQAIVDFRKTLIFLKNETNFYKVVKYKEDIKGVIKFFKSDYYETICNIKSEIILKKLRSELKRFGKRHQEYASFVYGLIEYIGE